MKANTNDTYFRNLRFNDVMPYYEANNVERVTFRPLDARNGYLVLKTADSTAATRTFTFANCIMLAKQIRERNRQFVDFQIENEIEFDNFGKLLD